MEQLTPYEAPKEKFDGERKLMMRLSTDFLFYSEKNLKIVPKDGGIVPFVLNKAQRYIHETLEKQKKEKGYVRALVVKARQQGCSTYIAGRYYWQVTKRHGVNAFILSHAQDTTKKLFRITRGYHDKCDPNLKQRTNASSASHLEFAALDSTYTVGTAGSVEVGRGSTIHYFHGSEVAFWPNADMHFMGVMQSIPDGKLATGSEVVLESTANGINGKFYDLVQDALNGKGEYIVIFTPWYWQDEYSTLPPVGWTVPEDSENLQKIYELTDGQMYWRQNKIQQLGSEWRFKQEYPSTIDEAFQTSGDESFLSPQLIDGCRVEKPDLLDGTIRIGACDPAWTGDRSGIGYKAGNRVKEILYYKNKNPTELANICGEYIRKHDLDRFLVDVIGIGLGVWSHLVDVLGYGDIVKPCRFSESATDSDPRGNPIYLNHRAECWGRMKEAMESGDFEIPNSDELSSDLQAPQYHYNNNRGLLQLESKKDMKSRGVASPDGGDVIAMMYSIKVNPNLRNIRKRAMVIPTDYDPMEM